MIEINLLPEEYRKKRDRMKDMGEVFKKYKTLLLPAAGAIVGIILIMCLFVIVYPKIQRHRLNNIKAQWNKIEKDYNDVGNLKKELKNLQEVMDTINKMEKNRILWAKTLNNISDCLPKEIQLTELSTKIEKAKEKSERMVLTISGLVPLSPGERAVEDFIKALRANQDFIKDFPEIELPSTQITTEGFKRFTMKCYTAEVKKEEAVQTKGKANETK